MFFQIIHHNPESLSKAGGGKYSPGQRPGNIGKTANTALKPACCRQEKKYNPGHSSEIAA